jgi:hypothetical protein
MRCQQHFTYGVLQHPTMTGRTSGECSGVGCRRWTGVHLCIQGTTTKNHRGHSVMCPLGRDVFKRTFSGVALVVCAALWLLPLVLQGSMEALPLSLIAHTADGSRHTVTPPPAHILPASSINSALVRTHPHDSQ